MLNYSNFLSHIIVASIEVDLEIKLEKRCCIMILCCTFLFSIYIEIHTSVACTRFSAELLSIINLHVYQDVSTTLGKINSSKNLEFKETD